MNRIYYMASPVRQVRLRPLRFASALLAGFFLFSALGGCGGKEKTAEEKALEELGLNEERKGDLTKSVTKLEVEERHYGGGGGGGGGLMGLGGGTGLGGGMEGIAGTGPGLGSSHGGVAGRTGGGDLDAIAERIAGAGRAEDAFTKRTIIKTGTLLIHVDDVDEGLTRVQKVVAAHGGELVKVERRKYEDDDSCVVAVRVPAEHFDAAIASTQKIGDVVELVVEAEDVTEEYIDLQMRLDNQIKARDRFIEILRTRTGKLEDVVALQREINGTTEEIERLAGKLLYLKNRAAFSSIYITLHRPREEVVAAEKDELSVLEQVLAALVEAVNALFGVILFLVQVAIVAVPLALVALLALLGGRRLYLWARRKNVAGRLLGRADESEEE
jgi:DNA repair exonuclease SbcCD ATPase subunit